VTKIVLDRAPDYTLLLKNGPACLPACLNSYRRNFTSFLNISPSCLCLALLVTVTFSAFGQEKLVSIGLGAEINMNSGSKFGVGAMAALGFNVGRYWAVGLMAKGSHDFSSAWVLEGGGVVRACFSGRSPRQGEYHSGLFAQAEGGVHYIIEDNVHLYEGETLLRPMGGLRGG
jgi:hypothetical protein